MQEYEKPWQVMPAKIVMLAKEYASKDTDFDHQLAFLLLDIGVEAALKAYLINKKKDVEKIIFPDLLKAVKEELASENLMVDLDDVEYYHRIRNKLYHQGDGVKPTDENLKRYTQLASLVVKTLLHIEFEDTKSNLHTVNVKAFADPDDDTYFPYPLEWFAKDLLKDFHRLQLSFFIMAEMISPKWATRRVEMKLKSIWDDFPDNEDDSYQIRAYHADERRKKFSGLGGNKDIDQDILDDISKDPNNLYALICFQELGDEVEKEWKYYKDVLDFVHDIPATWIRWIDHGIRSAEEIGKKNDEITTWIKNHQKEISARLENYKSGLSNHDDEK